MSFPLGPYIPLLLTLLVAGLGHFYLRYWRRGLLWLGLYLVTIVFLSTYSPRQGELSPFILNIFNRQIATVEIVFPLSILLLCLIDVYLLQRSRIERSMDGQ